MRFLWFVANKAGGDTNISVNIEVQDVPKVRCSTL